MNTLFYTHAEAQAILDFVGRALARSNDERLSIGYAVQLELDAMCKQVGIEQPFWGCSQYPDYRGTRDIDPDTGEAEMDEIPHDTPRPIHHCASRRRDECTPNR